MTIGSRIKVARKSNGLSTRKLGEMIGVSATAISKYERDLDVPGSEVLIRLGNALKLSIEYFFRSEPNIISIDLMHFRKHASLPKKEEQQIKASVMEWLERYQQVEDILGIENQNGCDFKYKISNFEDVENAAADIRDKWNLGKAPIKSMMDLFENKGIKVYLIKSSTKFDALTFSLNNCPVIAINASFPGDRQRFSLAHELGHIVLDFSNEIDEEKAAHRFAGAFLVPADAAKEELGPKRISFTIDELAICKKEYGMSMQAWIRRAQDLGIISKDAAVDLYKYFNAKSWRGKEPGEQIPPEIPMRFEQLVYRAYAEALISQSKAAELFGQALPMEPLRV